MTDAPSPLARINALTTNARNTWFVLLGVLVFVAITLMGVEHIDFYGVDRQTALPLVNITVPTRLFFVAAPILITAIYAYFHLYLIRLWDALGTAKPCVDDTPLGDAITPWLVSDVALRIRARRRETDCVTPRAMEIPNAVWNTLFAWVAGPGIIGWLWWASMPARNWMITGLAGTCLILALAFGYASFAMMRRRMEATENHNFNVWNESALGSLAMIALALGGVTQGRTRGDINTLAPIHMPGAALVQKPADWLPHSIARDEFLAQWCARKTPACEPPAPPQPGPIARLLGHKTPATPPATFQPPAAFKAEWQTRRAAALASLKKPHWSAPAATRPDFRGATLYDAFLSGANLRGAQMEGADLWRAQMEGANLWRAQMEGADLSWAQMQGADLSWAQMQGADLGEAQMQGADLGEAQMQGANLWRAQMEGANLRGAQMQGAYLGEAQMEGANLRGAQMEGADLWRAQMEGANLRGAQMQGAYLGEAQMEGANLRGAQMEGADLWRAQMEGADLSWALLTGTPENPNILLGTSLRASINNGGALRDVDLRPAKFDNQTDWRNTFFDGSVLVPDDRRPQIGQPCLWTWIAENPAPLPDEIFFARWRGWLALDDSWNDDDWRWLPSVPEEWRDVGPIAPPNGCVWHTDPLPDAGASQ